MSIGANFLIPSTFLKDAHMMIDVKMRMKRKILKSLMIGNIYFSENDFLLRYK